MKKINCIITFDGDIYVVRDEFEARRMQSKFGGSIICDTADNIVKTSKKIKRQLKNKSK